MKRFFYYTLFGRILTIVIPIIIIVVVPYFIGRLILLFTPSLVWVNEPGIITWFDGFLIIFLPCGGLFGLYVLVRITFDWIVNGKNSKWP